MLALLTALMLSSPPPPPMRPPDPRTAAEALSLSADSWNRGDLDGFCQNYAEDAVMMSPSGVTKGRVEILKRYRGKYTDAASRGALSFKILDSRTEGKLTSVAAEWTLSFANKPAATGHTLVVMKQVDDHSWKIVHDASM